MIKQLLTATVFVLTFSTQAIPQDIPQTKPDALSFCYEASRNAEGIMVLRQEGVPIEYVLSILGAYPEPMQRLYAEVVRKAYSMPIEQSYEAQVAAAKSFGDENHKACLESVLGTIWGELL